jgi:hypothetical protein
MQEETDLFENFWTEGKRIYKNFPVSCPSPPTPLLFSDKELVKQILLLVNSIHICAIATADSVCGN